MEWIISICVIVIISYIVLTLIVETIGTVFTGILIILIVLGIISMIARHRGKGSSCPTCKKKFALKEIQTFTIDEKDISILTELKTKNIKGDVISTSEQYIPGKRITYRTDYKCKYCGKGCYSTYTKDKKLV